MSNSQKKNKWKQILFIISCYVMCILFIVGGICLEDDFNPFYCISGFVVIVILFAGGTKGLMDYRKENLPSEERNVLEKQQHYTKMEKRKKRQKSITRKHDTMLKEFFWNTLEYHFQMNCIAFVLGAFVCCLIWMQYQILPTYLFFVALGILAVVLIIHWIYVSTGSNVKQFEKMIVSSGFDFKEVDFDYMHGTICVALSGYLCIGQQYSIYCAFKEESFIIPYQNIIGVEKRVFSEKIDEMGGKVDRFYIRIYTDNYWRAFSTDDIGADVVLQEYEKRGVKTRVVDQR